MIEWFSKLKDGFQTQIGERGCRLSSGQKQRLNIIRLILTMRYHPEMIFIIDEITSNLDSATRELAINLLHKGTSYTGERRDIGFFSEAIYNSNKSTKESTT